LIHNIILDSIIGFGTVGSGTVTILFENQALIKKRLGCPLLIKKVAVRDPSLPRRVSVPEGLLTTEVETLFKDPEIKIVVEQASPVFTPLVILYVGQC